MMPEGEFRALVAKMRAAQRRFDIEADNAAECLTCEMRVDHALADYDRPARATDAWEEYE